MGQGRFERFAPLTGVVFFVLMVFLLIFSGETPDTGDSSREIARFWIDNEGEQIAASIVGLIASAFFLWFAASLRSELGRAEGGTGRLARIAFAGAVLATAGLMILWGMTFAAAESADDVPPLVTHAVTAVNNGLFFPLVGGFGLFLLGSALGTLRSGALPAVAGWIALLLGILCFTPVAWIALLAGIVWVLVVSVLLYRRTDRAATAPAASPGSPS